jgi:hypothetical protein
MLKVYLEQIDAIMAVPLHNIIIHPTRINVTSHLRLHLRAGDDERY